MADYTFTTVTQSSGPDRQSTMTTTTRHDLLVTTVRLPHRYPAIAVVRRGALSKLGRVMFGDGTWRRALHRSHPNSNTCDDCSTLARPAVSGAHGRSDSPLSVSLGSQLISRTPITTRGRARRLGWAGG